MKTIKFFSIIALAALITFSCGEKKAAVTGAISQAEIDSASYAVGVSLGSMVKQANFGELNMKEVSKAMADVLGDKTLKMDATKANEVIQAFVVKRQAAVSSENKEKGAEFLKANGTKDSVVTTASGLQYKVINAGSDIKPLAEDTVQVNYKGTLIDGKEFDSSYTRGEPATFPLGGVIKGWIEGLQLVGEGGKIRLFVPSELAYGEQQAGPTIGPNSTLIFDIELLKVKKAIVKPEAAPVKK